MPDIAIKNFLFERKEAWLKKKTKASMNAEQIKQVQLECENIFSLELWLPKAAKKASSRAFTTHPSKFSHPSTGIGKKNKENLTYVTPIISKANYINDGFLKTGNLDVAIDSIGDAAALDVDKFLNLKMQDDQTLLMHIKQDSQLAKDLLNISSSSYTELKENFLSIIETPSEISTSSKIKQVFFPVDDNYHLLSILTNSGIVFKLKERLDILRFSDKTKELREKKSKNEFSELGYSEIYNLTTIGYGGTKPQNISVLNNKNGGKAHLLASSPPVIEKRNTHFPKNDFFLESLHTKDFYPLFKSLQKIIDDNRNNINIRDSRDYYIQEIVNTIVDKMWEIRAISTKQYFENYSSLSLHQKIWLHESHSDERINSDTWLEKITTEISHWIIKNYEKTQGNNALKFGEQESKHIKNIVLQNKEALR